MLIKKNHPVSPIKSIMLLISISLFFVFSLASSKLYAVLNSPDVTHSAANYVECAEGRSGPGCPSGQELPPEQGPSIAFSDLISGPSTGLGDGKGSGVIVTVWGYNLGSTQGSSTIEFVDSLSVARTPHVYYWKNADGTLPSGPANLYESHGMQEIAFSIPDSALGTGRIKITVDGKVAVKHDTTTENPQGDISFAVRSGNIYHVKPTGNDSTGDGSFANPWLTVAKGDSTATGGDTLYVHDVSTTATGTSGSASYAYYNNRYFLADETNQFAYVSYPNKRAELYGKVGVQSYQTKGIVTSKLSVFASNCDDETLAGCTESGTLGISPSDWGRVIGNAITDRPGMCASGQAGAISGGIGTIEGAKIYGNYIYEYGCPNTGKLHHTTYATIRDNANDETISPPSFGWNYLKDNYSKNGIHFYDEDAGSGTECGQFSGDVLIHDNVVVNQGGIGISYESLCGWSNDARIYNNVLVNVGLPIDVDCTSGPECGGSTSSAIQVLDGSEGGISGTVYIHNNTVHTWDAQNQASTLQSCIVLRGSGDNATLVVNDNVCYTSLDRPFYTTFSFSQSIDYSDNTTGAGNVWFTSTSSPVQAITPIFDTAPITTDPLLMLTGSQISVGTGSPLINQSSTTIDHGIYGKIRAATSNVGAVQ